MISYEKKHQWLSDFCLIRQAKYTAELNFGNGYVELQVCAPDYTPKWITVYDFSKQQRVSEFEEAIDHAIKNGLPSLFRRLL